MKQKLRDGTILEWDDGQDRLLATLYGSVWGRALLKPLTRPAVSKLAGRFLSTKVSCLLIRPFIRKNNIDMTQFEPCSYRSYNEFFARKILPDARSVDLNPVHLISPCDSKLTVLPITSDGHFTIKHTPYTVSSLHQDSSYSSKYEGGTVLIFA